MAEESVDVKPKQGWFKSLTGGLSKLSSLKPLLLLLVLLVVVMIMFNVFSSSGSKTTSTKQNKGNYTTSLEYIAEIENKLKSVVGQIKGAGKTRVMISISSSPQLEIASNVEEKTVTTSAGTTTTVSTEPIIIKGDSGNGPLILKETLPIINGVIVVSEGAKDVKVKLDILMAVSTALGINSNIVEVFAGA